MQANVTLAGDSLITSATGTLVVQSHILLLTASARFDSILCVLQKGMQSVRVCVNFVPPANVTF